MRETAAEDLGTPARPDDALAPRLSERALAAHWGLSLRTLQRWRAAGTGPAHLRLGGRILYRRSDVRAFEVQHLTAPPG